MRTLQSLLPLPLTDTFRKENNNLSQDDLDFFLIAAYDGLVPSQAEADFLEACTEKQNLSEEWYIHRRWWLTASIFHKVANQKDDMNPTVAIVEVI